MAFGYMTYAITTQTQDGKTELIGKMSFIGRILMNQKKIRVMTQYIDKSALVAEIENRIEELQNLHKENERKLDSIQKTAILLCIDEYKVIFSFLDTLKTKEVDLEKESELIANEIMIEVQANKYYTNIYNTERNDFNHSHLWLAARKGIELGLKSQKGE